MATKSIQNADELIKHLDQVNSTNLIDVYIPSLGRTAKFKQLTVRQQTSLITGVISQEAEKNAFSYNRAVTNIITDSNTENVTIKLVDRGPVQVQLRCDTLGDHIAIGDKSYDMSILKYTVTDQNTSLINDTHSYTLSGMSVDYTTPSISRDIKLNKFAENKWMGEEGIDIISELFKVELAKFIVSIHIEQGEQEDIDIIMEDLDESDQLKVCDSLPVKITRHILTYIQNVKSIENSLLKLEEDVYAPTDITLFSV